MQLLVRTREDVLYWIKRENDVNECELQVARMLDMRKAYVRVFKQDLKKLFKRYGTNEKRFEALNDLHECTEFKVRGK